MVHLIKYHIIIKVKNFNMFFWPFIFPLILGTLFYFGFGKIEEADFETIPVALVETGEEGSYFKDFLKGAEGDGKSLIKVMPMEEAKARKALREKEVKGIYYSGRRVSLTVGANGFSESILQSLLDSYETGMGTIEEIAVKHPQKLQDALVQLQNGYAELVRQVSLGGRTTDGNAQFFYALVAMACLYGSFIGVGAAMALQADVSALGARRCVTPTHKLTLVLSEMLSSFVLHFFNVLVLLFYLRYVLKLDFQGQSGKMALISFIGCLIGVSLGIFIGSIGKLGEEAKIGILLGFSMTASFLAGLMQNTVKNTVEQYAPFINRINPAALIADAFYCINVYDDPSRYRLNLVTLIFIAAGFVLASFYLIRRERYDSI